VALVDDEGSVWVFDVESSDVVVVDEVVVVVEDAGVWLCCLLLVEAIAWPA